jgi:Na+-driven multidrug efflux pump
LRIGLPAGGEFALMFVYMGIIYWIIRRFGRGRAGGIRHRHAAEPEPVSAGHGRRLRGRPIVGQNYAAGKFARVRETFVRATLIGAVIMAALTLLCQWRAEWLVRAFTTEPGAIAVGTQFLQLISLNFIASGLVFTCSAVFQGLGNTVPAVLSAATRLVSFIIPAMWLTHQPGFRLVELWYVSIASMTVQAIVSLWLVRSELRRRMPDTAAEGAAALQAD